MLTIKIKNEHILLEEKRICSFFAKYMRLLEIHKS